MKPKSKSQLAEELAVALEIKGASSFAAHLRMGPHEKYTVRDLPDFEAAAKAARQLEADHSRFSRRAMVFAINARGRETLCTPELVALAASL
jgi:hypothetical protein